MISVVGKEVSLLLRYSTVLQLLVTANLHTASATLQFLGGIIKVRLDLASICIPSVEWKREDGTNRHFTKLIFKANKTWNTCEELYLNHSKDQKILFRRLQR
jgi:hypothetical protein